MRSSNAPTALARGLAVDVRDPEYRMRVLVSVPTVFGDEMRWVDACAVPNAGSVPAVGQQLWVTSPGD